MLLEIATMRRVALIAKLSSHKKVCRQCTTLTPIRNRWCDEGWEISHRISQTNMEIIQLTPRPPGEQGSLF